MAFDCTSVQTAILRLCPTVVGDPAIDPFHPWVPTRGFLYPANYRLTKEQFDALRAACIARGQRGFLVQSSLREMSDELERDCIRVAWRESDPERAWIRSPLESVMIDDEASWAVIFSPDDFAVIGGKNDLIDDFFRRLGTTSADNLRLYFEEMRPPHDLRLSLTSYLVAP